MVPLQTLLADAGGYTPEITTRIALALTYDETDYNGLVTWTRLGDGPRLTRAGLQGDGFGARLLATSLPSWMTSSSQAITLHAAITPGYEARNATRDAVVTIGNNDATANPKLELAIADDAQVATEPNVVARCYTGSMQTKVLARRNWRYEYRFPTLLVGIYEARPQAVHFLDAATMLISAHYENTVSRVYKVRVSDGTPLGYFDFDQADLGSTHINACAESADGRIWFCGNDQIFRVNLEASLRTGAAVIDVTYDVAAAGGSFFDITTIAATEYVICGEYLETGTPRLVVFPFSLVSNGGTFNIADRTNRYQIDQRTQGVKYYGGNLYTSLNRTTAEGSGGRGYIKRFTLNLAAADDSVLTAQDAIWYAPSQYPEDLAFHPTDGRLWTSTEGLSAVGSDDGWLALWSTDLTATAQENHYTLEYNGAGTVRIKINGRLFEDMAWTPTINPAAISVGGLPAASAGQQTGFFAGLVRSVLVQDSALTARGYGSLVLGRYEPNTLDRWPITITNPGAETGDTTGWTNETGTLAVRSANPVARTGTYYFSGGSNAATRARQRFDLLALTGLSGAQVDAGGIWAIVDWWQANFSDADLDTCSAGLRFLNGSSVQISQNIPTLQDITPALIWVPRSYGIEIPSGTRYVDIVLDMVRSSGTNLDGYIDDLALTIYRRGV